MRGGWGEGWGGGGGGGGGWGGGGGGRRRRKERKDMLEAGQSRGSIVCVNGVIIKQCGS